MESRTVTQVKVHILRLNPMTDRMEAQRIVAVSLDKDKLIEWYNTQKCEPYTDDRWHKSFQQGGPLEWFNPPMHAVEECDPHFGHGIQSVWDNIENYESYEGLKI